ncbi:hypothetical protein MNEG_1343 [Monoraphidium neglectum]|uniref:26S proteasome complex subunit SEM1 n=1 Tax=Monoraphidium neglectum TaxID=145388 RepID=A0A0D2LJN9_9CHLO|nr:hypothetical protein MNEG_1343 [Monoraphidium neglectum]KIZ06609.1 hypothetical protein MNEG_1343 [Monoraphidium neglectum]|eukprot:XP_013905628.1 hypothetical protein MNEG_1343 [Monoraphidium neglectum]
MAQEADKSKAAPKDASLEEDDAFEEFASHVVKDEAHAADEENQELWQADWDDEEVGEDFQQKLQRELGRHMKE